MTAAASITPELPLPSLDDFLSALAPHPLLWPHTTAECEEIRDAFRTLPPERLLELATQLDARAERIKQCAADPLKHGIEPDLWQDADSDLAKPDCELQYVSGPNRSTKSFRAAKRLVESALAYPGAQLLVVGKTDTSSKQIQQRQVWEFLEPRLGALNWGKHDAVTKVRYSEAGGFTDGLLVLPNRSIFVFQTDNQDPKPWEGKEWGARITRPFHRPDGSLVLNIGYWLDEDISLKWIEHATRRSRYRDAKGLWTFTPKDGITPAIKELLTGAVVVQSKPARLLPTARVLNCPVGEMPYRMQCAWQKARVRVIYVHIDDNPMPDYREKELARLQGASTEMIERFGYGFARDSIARALPQFGPWNIVEPKHLPERGTNYIFCDPHDDRAWFITKVRVTPGDTPEFYITGEWPDAPSYGEWAVPTERETSLEHKSGWDGDRGPAQWARVDGIVGYKKIFRELTIVRPDGPDEEDPFRRRLQLEARKLGRPVFEPIEDYYIDSRAGPRPHLDEHGQTCTVREFDKEHKDDDTGETLAGITFRMVSGDRIDMNLVRELVSCRRDKDNKICKPPRLYILRTCYQHIWAAENFTGRSGQEGASKDPMDNKRYIAGADLFHVEAGTLKSWRPGEEDEE